jgi:ribose transport system substrate-binding protein
MHLLRTAAVAATLLVSTLSACESSSAAEYRIGVVLPSLTSTSFIDLDKGIKAAVGRHPDVELVYSYGSSTLPDANQQMRSIETLITKQVDAIVIADAFPTAKPALTKALAEGIKVVIMDWDGTEIPSSETTVVASDNEASGRMAGEYIAKVLDGKGEVALLDGFPTVPVNYWRTDKARVALEAAGVEVVARLETSCLRSKGESSTENILTAHPDVDLIYSGCGDPILGAATAVERAGLTGEVQLMGFDATDEEIENIKAGTQLASVAQLMQQMGYVAGEKAVEAVRNGTVPDDVTTDTVVVDRENVDTVLTNQIPAE